MRAKKSAILEQGGEKRAAGSAPTGLMLDWRGNEFGGLKAARLPQRGAPGRIPAGFSLGLRVKHADHLVGRIRAGLSFSSFGRLCAGMGVTELELAALTDIAPRTLARRKKEGRLQFAESERLYRLSALFDKAVQALGSVPAARQWLKSPRKALGNSAPLDYARTEIGAREVEDLLGRIEHGVFS